MTVFSSERIMLDIEAEASPAAMKMIASLSALTGIDCFMVCVMWRQQETCCRLLMDSRDQIIVKLLLLLHELWLLSNTPSSWNKILQRNCGGLYLPQLRSVEVMKYVLLKIVSLIFNLYSDVAMFGSTCALKNNSTYMLSKRGVFAVQRRWCELIIWDVCVNCTAQNQLNQILKQSIEQIKKPHLNHSIN